MIALKGQSKQHKASLTVVMTRYGEPDNIAEEAITSMQSQNNSIVRVLFLDQKKIKVFGRSLQKTK
jgi:hypothetical protein